VIRVHLQNEYIGRALYWLSRFELPDHVFRKAHQWRRYDGRVEIGEPQPTAWYKGEELAREGIVGLYGYRKEGVDW
jgi:hypothetical protein